VNALPPLLTLSPERVARERARAELTAEDDRRWERKVWTAIGVAGCWLVLGYLILVASFRVKDPDYGMVAFWAALAIGNFGPVMTGLRFWVRAET